MQHFTIYSLGTCATCIFLFADARPFPPPTLLPALGHLVLAVTRATCSLHTYLFLVMAPAAPRCSPWLQTGRALIAGSGESSQGHFVRGAVAGGDIERSPAGGVHSSETAAARKMGPVGMEPPEHVPRLGDKQAALVHHKLSRPGRDPQESPAEDVL